VETFFGPVGIGAGGTIVLKRIEESNYFRDARGSLKEGA